MQHQPHSCDGFGPGLVPFGNSSLLLGVGLVLHDALLEPCPVIASLVYQGDSEAAFGPGGAAVPGRGRIQVLGGVINEYRYAA